MYSSHTLIQDWTDQALLAPGVVRVVRQLENTCADIWHPLCAGSGRVRLTLSYLVCRKWKNAIAESTISDRAASLSSAPCATSRASSTHESCKRHELVVQFHGRACHTPALLHSAASSARQQINITSLSKVENKHCDTDASMRAKKATAGPSATRHHTLTPHALR